MSGVGVVSSADEYAVLFIDITVIKTVKIQIVLRQ